MTKRRIAAHKGGRTARVPSGRITPQTLERIMAEKQRRGVTWADMVEEIWGDNTPSAIRARSGAGK